MNYYFGIWFQSILTRPCCLFSSSTSSSSLLSISLISLSTSSIPPSASFCVWVVLVYLWNSGLSLMSKYLNWNDYGRHLPWSAVSKKRLEKVPHLFCRYSFPCMDVGFHLPSKTHLPSSKTMILSINSKKPVWWVAMILIKSMMNGWGEWCPSEPGGTREDPLWPNQVVEEVVAHLVLHLTDLQKFEEIQFGILWNRINETDSWDVLLCTCASTALRGQSSSKSWKENWPGLGG